MADVDNTLPSRFRPIGVYRGLSQGPGSGRSFDANQSVALDGTKQKLRDSRLGSPFTFRVAPPTLLLDALVGASGGVAQTDSAFDPLLRDAFLEAEANLGVVLEQFDLGQVTLEDVEVARQGLLGTRGPAQGQNINIVEAANRSHNNFDHVVHLRNAFQKSGFYAVGEGLPGLRNSQKFINANGAEIFPQTDALDPNSNQAAVADLTQALDVVVQLNKIVNTPALTLLVNPESLQINYTKKQQYQDRNRFNYIFQSWGEDQVRLSVTGKSAGFVVGAGNVNEFNVSEVATQETANGFSLNPAKTSAVSGYQYASKLDSAAWQNLMTLMQFYRNNGYIYDRSGVSGNGASEAHLFIGTIEISYDQWLFIGNFENFSYQYTEAKQQGAIEFSFEFVASSIIDRGATRSGPSPVAPYQNPPTPSPSMAPNNGAPVIQDESVRTGRELQQVDPTQPSTCILDSLCDPFSGPGEPTLEEVLGPSFGGTILRPTGGG